VGIGLPAASVINPWRGTLYCVAVGLRTLVAMLATVLLGAPIGLALTGSEHSTDAAGGLVVVGLILLGLGFPVVSIILACVDWNGSAALLDRPSRELPRMRLREPRTLVRPLAYAVVMLTIGGAAAVLVVLAVVGSAVAIISPVLTAAGDRAVIGPFTVATVLQSVVAAVLAVGLLTALVVVSPRLAQAHAVTVRQVLTRPEQRLERDLTVTEQSRARLVRAFDIERRRIERDLHDGVQPQLMSVSMTLGLALAAMPQDAAGRSDVARAQDQAKETLDALRRFVRNIHPQVLIDHGLSAAVGELADTLAIPIAVDQRLTDRLPAEIETNLYFCIAELLTNVVKHSGATQASVRLQRLDSGVVEARVHDDGKGGAGGNHHDDGGLDGIADRVAALDGWLTIDSPLGGPTTVTISVPGPTGGRIDD
jgi:signal transduction histidine kinase